jgi:hypothetical protein
MDGQTAMNWLIQGSGGVIMALTVLDVFLTVLYARVGTSVFSNLLGRALWRVVRGAGRCAPRRHRGTVYSFAGPLILAVLVAVWAVLLILGAALVIYPRLAETVRTSGGEPTPTGFAAALYAAAGALSIVSADNLIPKSGAFKIFFVACSVLGVCIIPLTLTYVLQIYAALSRRNVTVLRAHLGTAETGDAAELIAGLGPQGDFEDATTWLSNMATGVSDVKETHHLYSLLMYFRFREPFYSVTHLALLTLDTVSLMKTGLDDRRYARLKESAALAELWRSSMHLLTGVAPELLPKGKQAELRAPPSDERRELWRRRYCAGLKRLRDAGIPTVSDERGGLRDYMALRELWDCYIVTFASFMAFDLQDVDPATTCPEEVHRRGDFRERLRSAG